MLLLYLVRVRIIEANLLHKYVRSSKPTDSRKHTPSHFSLKLIVDFLRLAPWQNIDSLDSPITSPVSQIQQLFHHLIQQ